MNAMTRELLAVHSGFTDPQDMARLRGDFPILHQQVNGRPLAYLDNAATTQKPRVVIDAVSHYYETINANVHRGVHTLSARATDAMEAARETVRRFINARSTHEIVFTRGTTEAINLVATSFGRLLKPGDEIILTEMEHHSNIVPWQLLCERSGAQLKVLPIDSAGELMLDRLPDLFSDRTSLLALTQVSNALGTVNPARDIVALAHARGVPVLVDGAQAVAHMAVDMQDLDCDFYAFSGHKLYGPTGIGVLYGKREWLERLPPWQGGGEMIRSVSFAGSTWADLPYKFEAGTPDISGSIGLAAAIDYVCATGLPAIAAHEHDLLAHATRQALEIPGLRIIGSSAHKAGILSFTLDGIHPHDMGTVLDHAGVAVRTGHHCAMPVMTHYGIPATTRASFALYNTRAEVDALIDGIRDTIRMFRP